MARVVLEFIFLWDENVITHIYAHSAQAAWSQFWEVYGKFYGDRKITCFRYDSRTTLC